MRKKSQKFDFFHTCKFELVCGTSKNSPIVLKFGPATSLFDGLFLKCVKRYELEPFT